MLAAAIENSDLSNPATLAQELRNLGRWKGAAGIHQFDENGNDVGDLVVLKKLHNGSFDAIGK